jgi:hypothetical protein
MADKNKKPTPLPNLGEGLRRKNRVQGGFLDGKSFTITDAVAIQETFEGIVDWKTRERGPVTKGNLKITYDIEGVDKPVDRSYSLGQTTIPYEDGVPVDEGQFVGPLDPAKQWRGITSSCAAGYYLDKLDDLKAYDEDTLVKEGFRAALVGISGTLMEWVPPVRKGDKDADARKPIAVVASVETKGGALAGTKPAGKTNGGVKKPVGKTVEEDVDDAAEAASDEESVETRVTDLVIALAAKGPITKAKMSQAINKAFIGEDVQMEAVSLAVKDSFLKKLAAAGEIAFDGKEISAA